MRLLYADYLSKFSRITNAYGDKSYPLERIQAIWESVKTLTPGQLDRVITDLIAEKERPPMREAFRALAIAYRPSDFSMESDQGAIFINCKWCSTSGFIMAKLSRGHANDVAQGYRHAFRCCFCDRADRLGISPRIPRWTKDYVPRYWPSYGTGEPALPEDADADPALTPEVLPASAPSPASPASMVALVKKAFGTRVMPKPVESPNPAPEEQKEFDL